MKVEKRGRARIADTQFDPLRGAGVRGCDGSCSGGNRRLETADGDQACDESEQPPEGRLAELNREQQHGSRDAGRRGEERKQEGQHRSDRPLPVHGGSLDKRNEGVAGQRRDRAEARGDESDLYRLHHQRLLRAVTRAVDASPELIEDACQSAWTTLLRCQPSRSPALFGWLRAVAVHQAYRLSRQERRDVRLEDLVPEGDWEAVLGTMWPLEQASEARRALRMLAALPALQREDLTLLVAGFSYREIAQLGGRTRSVNNVNKHLTKARVRIRRLDAAA